MKASFEQLLSKVCFGLTWISFRLQSLKTVLETLKIMKIIFFIQSQKQWNIFPQTLANFSGYKKVLVRSEWFCYRLPPTRPSAIMWSWKCIIKVRVKEQICWLRGMKSFFASKNVRDFFPRPFNIEQLVIFLSNDTSLRHQCPTYFLSLCGLKIILFYLHKIFHTPHGMYWVANGTFNTWNEIIIHNFNSFFSSFISQFTYEFKSTSNEKWHEKWLKRWTQKQQLKVLLIFHMKNHYLTEVEPVRLSMFNFPSTFIRLNIRSFQMPSLTCHWLVL